MYRTRVGKSNNGSVYGAALYLADQVTIVQIDVTDVTPVIFNFLVNEH